MKKLYFLCLVLVLTMTASLFLFSSDTNDDWLSVNKNIIVDSEGKAVRLTGINWFGFNCSERVFHGLWSINLRTTLRDVVAGLGFNILRLPISTEVMNEWMNGIYRIGNVNTYANPELLGLNSLEVFEKTIEYCKEFGIKIMIDVHSAKADNSGHLYPLWYNNEITPEIFYQTLAWMAERYKNNDTIIAYDLENEPHGKPYRESLFAKWDTSMDDNNWKYAAEEAARRILANNPNVLILVEGIEAFPKDGVTWTSRDEKTYHSNWWGGNLRGVKSLPIDLGDFQHKLVYSPHDYGPKVYEQSWFQKDFTKQSLYDDCWGPNWYFIVEDQTAPLLIGEWGGIIKGNDQTIVKNRKWLNYFKEFIIEKNLHHTFWCLNSNSGDTGGILDNWGPVDTDKYAIVEPTLWQDRNGKFVGLDHQIPLGNMSIGTTITEYYNNGNLAPLPPEAGSTIALTAPQNNEKIPAGQDVLVQADVSTYLGETVSKVEFFVNNSRISTDYTAPYQYNWSSAPDGAHILQAKAYLNTDEIIESNKANILVGNYIDLQISSPEDGGLYNIGEDLVLVADVDTNISGNAVVRFFDGNGALLATDSNAPYEYQIDTTEIGTYSYEATAVITANNNTYTDSDDITITLDYMNFVLLYKCNNTQVSNTQRIEAEIKIANNDSKSYSLDDISVRYYYTPQNINDQAFNCWWAQMGNQYVQASFGSENSNVYCEISFNGNRTLSGNSDSGTILFCIHRNDWNEMYNQEQHHSFNGQLTGNYHEWNQICIFYKGHRIYGVQP